MNFFLEINNKVKCNLSKRYFEKIISDVVGESKIKSRGKFNISLALVSTDEIRKINKKYRKKNKPTDVISFSDYSLENKNEKKDFFLEIIICLPFVRKSAKEDKVKIEKEMAYVFSHGFLHCLGHRHSKEMYAIQDKIASLN